MREQLKKILKAAENHCKLTILPEVDDWNKKAKWPRAASNKAARAGLTGLYCPEEFGGQGLSLAEGIQVYEELGKGDGAYAFALSMHNICTYAICGFAHDTFKKEWARDLTSGKKLANFALTEAQSGSDPATMYTKAKINKNGNFVINGAKAWVSLATEADVYLVVAKTSDEAGHKDMVMLAVEKEAKGLSFGELYDTPSYKFLPLAEMYLDNVEVPKEHVILPIGKAFGGSLMAIDIARASIAAGCTGLMQTALDIALRYSNSRAMFNKTALQLDGIQWMLGEIATDIEISKLLYKKAAEALDTKDGTLFAAHAKLYVPDAALKATNTVTQVLGGMGLIQSYQLDRLSRLAQMLKIVDGTTEIQRVVIGRALQRRAKELPPIPMPQGYKEQ